MEDSRDKRPVYMSTFQKRIDRMKSEIDHEIMAIQKKNKKYTEILMTVSVLGIISLIAIILYLITYSS
jgi:hypothetical protein